MKHRTAANRQTNATFHQMRVITFLRQAGHEEFINTKENPFHLLIYYDQLKAESKQSHKGDSKT